MASLRGDGSSVPQLPHIAGAVPLTPIGEASREGTRMTIPVSLPPISKEHGIDGKLLRMKCDLSCPPLYLLKLSPLLGVGFHFENFLLLFHIFIGT